jgi:chaperonin GroEL (HSP60 family)
MNNTKKLSKYVRKQQTRYGDKTFQICIRAQELYY